MENRSLTATTSNRNPRRAFGTAAAALAIVAGLGLAALAIFPTNEPLPAPEQVAAAPVAPTATSIESPAPASPADVRLAVDRGLDYLRRIQDPASGGWSQDVGFKLNSEYNVTTASKPHVGVTSLALMAFLSGGHLPGRGKHGDVVQRGTDFVLSGVDKDTGYISIHGTRMYSHAYATLFLAEIYGMTHRLDVKEKLQHAVNLTVESQNRHGSWRYNPSSPESDMSITVCQIMALRAARNVGIRVPKATIDRAYEYVDRSAYKNRAHPYYGGFKYQEKEEARTSFALTSAGIASLNHSGIYEHKLIKAGIDYLQGEMGRLSAQYPWHYFYWYGHYYGAQVFFFAGDENSRLWDWYWSRMSRELVSGQESDGSWPCRVGPGTAFSTAVACIILQIPNQYLPIFHR